MAFCANCGKELPAGSTFCPNCGAPVSKASPSAPQQPVSGFDSVIKESKAQDYWVRRLVAFLIDAVIIYVVVGILAVALAVPFFFLSGLGVMIAVLAGTFSFVSGVILILYFAASEVSRGATLGKSLMGLKVTARGARNPNLGEAVIRNISKIYWLLLLLDVVVGLATSKEYTQKFSDRYAGTSVVPR